MPLLDVPEASYYCGTYTASAGAAQGSLRTFSAPFRVGQRFAEDTREYAELRDCSLREAERFLFLAIAQYRRCFDLLLPGAAAWAHVTMYYGSLFAATSLLGMFGVRSMGRSLVIDVLDGTPGSQEVEVVRRSSTYRGSHEQFWDFFYASIPPVASWVAPALRPALAPVGGNPAWQIQTRNEVNYDAYVAIRDMVNFKTMFRRTKFPGTLPGPIQTQFSIFDGLVKVAANFAREFHLASDALTGFGTDKRDNKIRRWIFDAKSPAMERSIPRKAMIV